MVLIYMFIVHVHILQSDIITSSLLVCNIDNKLYTISIKIGKSSLGNTIIELETKKLGEIAGDFDVSKAISTFPN